ncbi:unnamed protein product [Lymnaea stagnalis]|uniref:Uncharacterized protein n=1 Tax=Lymnaea stagnalis TaxID=6523 RepID=A0AAV2HPI9_LYMST
MAPLAAILLLIVTAASDWIQTAFSKPIENYGTTTSPKLDIKKEQLFDNIKERQSQQDFKSSEELKPIVQFLEVLCSLIYDIIKNADGTEILSTTSRSKAGLKTKIKVQITPEIIKGAAEKNNSGHFKRYFEKFRNLYEKFIKEFDKERTNLEKLKLYLSYINNLENEISEENRGDLKFVVKFVLHVSHIIEDVVEKWDILAIRDDFQNVKRNLNIFFHELNREIQRSLNVYETITTINASFHERLSIIHSILTNSPLKEESHSKNKQLSEIRKKLITVMKRFIIILAAKSLQVNDFNEIFYEIGKLEEDLKKTVKEDYNIKAVLELIENILDVFQDLKKTDKEDYTIKVVLELIENILDVFQDIVQVWNQVNHSVDFDDRIKKLSGILKELNRGIKENRSGYKKMEKINELFSKRKNLLLTNGI